MSPRFDRFVLDTRARRLLSGGEPVHLSPKAFDLLVLLVDARPAVVEKAAIRAHLWPGIHVGDAGLGNLVAEIRAALGTSRADSSLIRNVHGVGYAFGGDVRGDAATRPPAANAGRSACWLLLDGQTIALRPGENIIGRDGKCAVWIDANEVSRRHARIDVADATAGRATIEDLGSTNGTFVAGRRIQTPVDLSDGDRVRVGRVTLVFRASTAANRPTKRVRQT